MLHSGAAWADRILSQPNVVGCCPTYLTAGSVGRDWTELGHWTRLRSVPPHLVWRRGSGCDTTKVRRSLTRCARAERKAAKSRGIASDDRSVPIKPSLATCTLPTSGDLGRVSMR